MTKIQHCDFCGSKKTFLDYSIKEEGYYYYIECPDCLSRGPLKKEERAAIKAHGNGTYKQKAIRALASVIYQQMFGYDDMRTSIRAAKKLIREA